MKLKKIVISNLLLTSLVGCCLTQNTNFSVIVPTGAPSVAFISKLNDENFDTNSVPNNIVAEMIKGTYDIAVVDLIGGLTAIKMKNAPYKLASVITFGNFYIYSTGNDDNNIMEDNDNIVGFGQGNTPDILFKHLYSNINIDTYLAGVSDVAPIAASGVINNEKVDYCIIAEPVLYNVLNNQKASTYGKGKEHSSFQDEWKIKHGEKSSILGAAIYIKNDTYSEYSNQIDQYLNSIKDDINNYINDPSKPRDMLEKYGSKEEQAQKIGINSTVVKGVLEDDNSINIGYLASNDENFDNIVKTYLNVVKPGIIDENNYL